MIKFNKLVDTKALLESKKKLITLKEYFETENLEQKGLCLEIFRNLETLRDGMAGDARQFSSLIEIFVGEIFSGDKTNDEGKEDTIFSDIDRAIILEDFPITRSAIECISVKGTKKKVKNLSGVLASSAIKYNSMLSAVFNFTQSESEDFSKWFGNNRIFTNRDRDEVKAELIQIATNVKKDLVVSKVFSIAGVYINSKNQFVIEKTNVLRPMEMLDAAIDIAFQAGEIKDKNLRITQNQLIVDKFLGIEDKIIIDIERSPEIDSIIKKQDQASDIIKKISNEDQLDFILTTLNNYR